MIFCSGNPTLTANTFTRDQAFGSGRMTLTGTVNKTGFSLLILIGTAAVVWNGISGVGAVMPLLWTGMIGGAVVGLVTAFKKTWAPVTTPIYAVFEGVFLGTVSLIFNIRYPG